MKPLDKCVLLLATGLGVGYVPWAPGTFGSLWGLLLVWGLQSSGTTGVGQAVIAVCFILAGVPICEKAANALGRKDPGSVVWDEIAAFPVVFAGTDITWTTAIAGFLLFRLFDIAKPWPVRRFERFPGGWGIMADDVAAGLYACACLWVFTQVLMH